MGLPGLRGPPGTKVSHIFYNTSYMSDSCIEFCLVSFVVILLSSQGLPGYKGEKVSYIVPVCHC